MKFVLVDRIVACEPGERIRTVKALSLAEEYLADHFPTFPVLPGVLMLEALVQSAAWLVRLTYDFQHSLIELREARNVSYKSFVRPGEILEMDVTVRRMSPQESEFTGTGSCAGREVVKARFRLVHSNLGDERPDGSEVDRTLQTHARRAIGLLRWPDGAVKELAGQSAWCR